MPGDHPPSALAWQGEAIAHEVSRHDVGPVPRQHAHLFDDVVRATGPASATASILDPLLTDGPRTANLGELHQGEPRAS